MICVKVGEPERRSPQAFVGKRSAQKLPAQMSNVTVAVPDEDSTKVASDFTEGQVAEEFFRETASQLTYFGLSRLHAEVRDIINSKCPAVLRKL